MKTFLIPTDFSDCATNALRFAADFAASLKQDVHLVVLHVVNQPMIAPAFEDDLTSTQLGMPHQYLDVTVAQQEELTKMAEAQLKALEEEYSHLAPLVRCSGLARTGLFLQEIEHMLKESQADLVVMGTCGMHDFPESIFATNTYAVVKQNLADVLVVSDGLRFRLFKNLVFAADLDENNAQELRRTITWAAPNNARILVTHIENYDTEDLTDSQVMTDLWAPIKSVSDYPNIEYLTELASSIEEGLEKIMSRESVDLLVMCPREYSFIEGLFHSSHTRAAVQHPETVVLCLAHKES